MKNGHRNLMYLALASMIIVMLFNLFSHQIVTFVAHLLGLCVTFIQFSIPFLPIIFSILLLYSFGQMALNLIKTNFYIHKLRITKKFPSRIYHLSLKLKVEKRIVLFEDTKPRAFCAGILHPKIYISTSLIRIMNLKELEAILLHERYHLVKNHNLFILIFSFISNMFLFFPFINDLYQNYIERKEIEADRSTLNSLNDSSILVASFKKLLSFDVLKYQSLSYISSYSNYSSLEIRIKEIIGLNPIYSKLKTRNIIISLLSFSILTGTVLYPIKITHAHNDKHQTVMCLEKKDCQGQHCT